MVVKRVTKGNICAATIVSDVGGDSERWNDGLLRLRSMMVCKWV